MAETDSVPAMWIRSIMKRPRSLLLMVVGIFCLVLGVTRQQIEGVGLGAALLLMMGGFHLILVAIDVERERRDSVE